tara:strand:- start:3534 stop:4319 length:786 start_codon:yes stop_codon:yes gene_type:complete
MTLPPLFISHGAPDLLLNGSAANQALKQIGLPDLAAAVVVISAHWESETAEITASERPATIHDFRGFGPALERAIYPAAGAPELAGEIHALLQMAGIAARLNRSRGLDHGAWIPLALMRPEADIPVIQISLPRSDAAAIALGRALAPLSGRGVQLVGSGSLTHALADAFGPVETAPSAPFAAAFHDWARPLIARGDLAALSQWRDAPHAARNHPTPEHFRPLLTAIAAGQGQPGRLLHHSWSRGVLAMDVWRFGEITPGPA